MTQKHAHSFEKPILTDSHALRLYRVWCDKPAGTNFRSFYIYLVRNEYRFGKSTPVLGGQFPPRERGDGYCTDGTTTKTQNH
ncbi:hypothetical protein Smp_175150 [Schistosoma mansoni]|uniref:hypothetical protein n=1 Tax=Schistosoma mansoni TaxID=6183 RepID=UPI00022DC9C4|nr:hypothetical protein Smp_175150 [Schistosoma mansoni]|eukprot:XP_018655249.1 hypothetical protein Smp_175150 [Schistosoma mansoni]